jgi:hypothetical protein
MSFDAMIWAHRQTCGNVARKAVLMALANWADADGFVKALLFEHLGQATELSRSGVYERLRELEVGGLLTRERGHHADGRAVSVKLSLEGSFSNALNPPSQKVHKTMEGPPMTSHAKNSAATPERRVDDASSARRSGVVSLGRLEAQCRILAGASPAAAHPNFGPIIPLVREGAREADVIGGVTAAMALPDFRPRSWAAFVGFVRREPALRASASSSADSSSLRRPRRFLNPLMNAQAQLYAEAIEEEARAAAEARNGV